MMVKIIIVCFITSLIVNWTLILLFVKHSSKNLEETIKEIDLLIDKKIELNNYSFNKKNSQSRKV